MGKNVFKGSGRNFIALNTRTMTNFSVTSSILSAADIAVFVQEKYALPAPVTCQLLKTGINHTYKVDCPHRKFVFRIYSHNWRTKEQITEELKLLLLLKENTISVSYPIADATGNFIHTIHAPEGVRFAVLFSFAEGHKILHYNKQTHFEVGRLMAQIHALTKDLQLTRPTYTPAALLNNALEKIRPFLPDETYEMQFLQTSLPVLENELLNADEQQLRKGIVHLDIWFDNLNIAAANNSITLFDFDFCGNGWLCLDIAYYVLQLHSTEKDEMQRGEKMASFYKGYESIETISAEEKRLVPILGVCLYYFYLGIQCSRFENWSNTFLNEVYLKRFITVLVKGYYEQAVKQASVM